VRETTESHAVPTTQIRPDQRAGHTVTSVGSGWLWEMWSVYGWLANVGAFGSWEDFGARCLITDRWCFALLGNWF
jgi:hypothetical protein